MGDNATHPNADRTLLLGHIFEDRKLLVGIQQEMRKGLDQAILALTSAALALSLTVVKDLSDDAPERKGALVLAWVFFGVGIMSTLAAMWLTTIAVRRRETLTLMRYEAVLIGMPLSAEADAMKQNARTFGQWADYLQFASVLLFALGILCVGLFVFSNIPGGAV